nr:MAG TPA: hypothetical protein [Caudoviricetes sp.]
MTRYAMVFSFFIMRFFSRKGLNRRKPWQIRTACEYE